MNFIKNNIIAIVICLIATIAFSQSHGQDEAWIFEEYGLTLEQYIDITNHLDNAIQQLIDKDVKFVPADYSEKIDIEVKKIFAADIVSMTQIQVQNLIAQAIVDKTDIEISGIFVKTLAQATSIEFPILVEAILAEATEIQVSNLIAVSAAEKASIDIEKIISAVFVLKTEIQIKKIMAATYVSSTSINLLDCLERSGFKWIIMEMKSAKAAGNEELYQKLQKKLIKAINIWIETEQQSNAETVDPELG